MTLLTNETSFNLWHDVVKHAESSCCITLNHHLEAYLTSLLMRYSNQPELAQQVFAQAFLEATQLRERERIVSLQHVGDQCLLYAGLYPLAADHKHVKLSYFVDLGRSAYANISQSASDVYWLLARQFVALMDVLQSIRPHNELLPLQAYEQWNELGSKRALLILQSYAKGQPFKKY